MLPILIRNRQALLAYAATYVCTDLLCPTRAPNLFYGKKIGEKNRLGAPAPKDPKSRGLAPESLPAYPAVNTAAAIGERTVGIRTPLSDVSFLLTGFGGRRRPDQVPIGALTQAFSGFRRKSRTMSAKEKARALSRSDIAGGLTWYDWVRRSDVGTGTRTGAERCSAIFLLCSLLFAQNFL